MMAEAAGVMAVMVLIRVGIIVGKKKKTLVENFRGI
jgi:hypothetical protein